MKNITIILLLVCSKLAYSQELPTRLVGTWKIENADFFEHWDLMNKQEMRGISYAFDGQKLKPIEYLHIQTTKKETYLNAQVVKQNEGKSIPFNMIQHDSSIVFINAKHDFPQRIAYTFKSNHRVLVELSSEEGKSMSYFMIKQANSPSSTNENSNYDSLLAKKLNADDYGMKTFVMVILTSGTNKTTDKAFIDSCFVGHLANIDKLVEAGNLIVAGPFYKNKNNYRGIFIFDVPTIEEAELLLQLDPAVQAQLLNYELFRWYGSAALPCYLDESDKIWKVKP